MTLRTRTYNDAQYKLVPREPNDAAQKAGAEAIRFDTTVLNKLWTGNAVYRAQLAAVPDTLPGVIEHSGLPVGYFSMNGGSTYADVDPKYKDDPDVFPLYDHAAPAQSSAPHGWRKRLEEMKEAGYTFGEHNRDLVHVLFDSVIGALDELEAQPVERQELSDCEILKRCGMEHLAYVEGQQFVKTVRGYFGGKDRGRA